MQRGRSSCTYVCNFTRLLWTATDAKTAAPQLRCTLLRKGDGSYRITVQTVLADHSPSTTSSIEMDITSNNPSSTDMFTKILY